MAAQGHAQPIFSSESAYQLGADDSIKITVTGEPELSKTFNIDCNGAIDFPLIGDVQVEGLTSGQIEARLKEKLSDGYLINPEISIEVASYRPFYILGEVRNPGEYIYVDDTTISKAVTLAGGFTHRAHKKKVQILRSKKGKSQLYKEMPVETIIAPGDIILIKERFF